MSDSAWTVRGAASQDRRLIETCLSHAQWVHQHLDWLAPVDLLGSPAFLIASQDDDPVACLACPPDPPGVSWLRVFAVADETAPSIAWGNLWPVAAKDAMAHGARRAAALPTADWMPRLLTTWGFEPTNEVIFLDWRGGRSDAASRDMTVRSIVPTDLPDLIDVDNAAFSGLWRYSQPVLEAALHQAVLGTVVERDRAVVGYQITTVSALGAHLARLAVAPTWQHQGIGTRLVLELFRQLAARGLDRLSVNTQSDNEASLRLYRRLGFRETGQRYRVYEASLSR